MVWREPEVSYRPTLWAGERHAKNVVDLPAPARQHFDGITFAQAAAALFGEHGDQNRRAARLVVLRLVDAGRLRRVRAHSGRRGGSPDRFVVVG